MWLLAEPPRQRPPTHRSGVDRLIVAEGKEEELLERRRQASDVSYRRHNDLQDLLLSRRSIHRLDAGFSQDHPPPQLRSVIPILPSTD